MATLVKSFAIQGIDAYPVDIELTTLVSDTLTKILQLLKGIEKHCHI